MKQNLEELAEQIGKWVLWSTLSFIACLIAGVNLPSWAPLVPLGMIATCAAVCLIAAAVIRIGRFAFGSGKK